MTLRTQMDSGTTGLRYVTETSPGVLPVDPVWIPVAPNSYADFGSSITTAASQPISLNRQSEKGAVVDLNATAGWSMDFSFEGTKDLMQGFMFADYRYKAYQTVTSVASNDMLMSSTAGLQVGCLAIGENFANPENNAVNEVQAVTLDTSVTLSGLVDEASPDADAKLRVVGHHFPAGELDIDTSGSYPKIVYTGVGKDLTTLGLNVGERIYIGGDEAGTQFVNAANNGFKRIKSITATEIVIDKSVLPMVGETGTGLDIKLFFGDVLRNETGELIKTRTYQFERVLGYPDTTNPTLPQAQYVVGSIANELRFSYGAASIISLDMSFVSNDDEIRKTSDGLKAGTRPTLVESDKFNSTEHVKYVSMGIVNDGDYLITPLFAFLTDIEFTINNNVSPNKAIGVLGAIGATVGNFDVTGNAEAYFSNVEALEVVRQNKNVTIDLVSVKDNQGISFDMPLCTVGEARPNVELNQTIKVPLSFQAANASRYGDGYDHTVLITYFNYLPTAAE